MNANEKVFFLYKWSHKMLGSFFSGKMKHGQDFLRERDKDDK